MATGFEAFYRAEYAAAVRLAALLVGTADAEDVAQEAFLAVRDRVAGLERPGGYLRTTVVNRARDRARTIGRRVRWERLIAGSDSVLAEHRELLDVLAHLPYDQRAVLVLRLWEGWPDADIAGALGCTTSTVRSHAHRALATLREELHDAYAN